MTIAATPGELRAMGKVKADPQAAAAHSFPEAEASGGFHTSFLFVTHTHTIVRPSPEAVVAL